MSGLVKGKVALVTGAGSGIGRASALAFVREGAKVLVADVNDTAGEETVKLIEQAGGEAVYQHCDISKEADVEAMVAKVVQAFGRLDCAYNNAGAPGEGFSIVDDTVENFDFNYAVNLKGAWLSMKHTARQMIAQGDGGAIVTTSSFAGLEGVRNSGAYVAAKHGVIGLTKTGAIELASKNIRVNAICPGPIGTALLQSAIGENDMARTHMEKLTVMRRFGEPDEIANAAVWLCSDQASYLTGVSLPVDGGMSVA
ncbi:MAG: short chain dehydrogenase [Gammaproteobacteria bacterium]|nr:MAG: short chain dehydrogenase [Gammaproteobacteria bacterium]RLA52835.1 MAG: short chain dehydrogenase [Gammaproteobacteria bacterium]